MNAMVMTDFGGPDVLTLQEWPDPQPGPKDLHLRVLAAAVNPVDCKTRQAPRWGDRKPPMILGFDVCGEVVAMGPEVTGFSMGDTVIASPSLIREGSYAEQVCVDFRTAAHASKTLSSEENSALPLVTLTAWESLVMHGDLSADDTVLIHAGAGGVGHIAIQLAKATGARVITTAGQPDSISLCEEVGADHIINYHEQDVTEAVMTITKGLGCNIVYDTVGGDVFNQSIDCLRHFGRLVTIVPGVPGDQINALFAKSASIHFEFMGCRLMNDLDPAEHGRILAKAIGLVESGQIRPHISHTYSLDEIPEAHKQQESQRTRGKLAISMT